MTTVAKKDEIEELFDKFNSVPFLFSQQPVRQVFDLDAVVVSYSKSISGQDDFFVYLNHSRAIFGFAINLPRWECRQFHRFHTSTIKRNWKENIK